MINNSGIQNIIIENPGFILGIRLYNNIHTTPDVNIPNIELKMP